MAGLAAALLPAFAVPQDKPRLLFGHRGASMLAPENTVPAFQKCVELGCDVNELDVYRTADNVIVVIHDATVDRTTNGTGRVSSMTLAELKALDAGYRFTPDGGQTYPYRGQGVTIPTIEEIVREVPTGRFNVDMKDHANETAQLLAEEIQRLGAEDRFIVGSFNDATVRAFRQFAPNVSTLASVVEAARFTALFWQGRADEHEPESDMYELPVGTTLDPAGYAEAANALGQLMIYWTINDLDLMRGLLENGADGIITDDVAGAMELYREMGYKP